MATDVLELPPSSRNSLFDRAVNSFSTTPDCRTVIHSYSRPTELLREVIHIFFPPTPSSPPFSFFFFFGILQPRLGPTLVQVRLGLCPIKRPSFSTVGVHGFAYFCLERRTKGGEGLRRHVAEKRKNSPFGRLLRRTRPPLPSFPSFLRDPPPPSPSIRVFRNWQLIGN